MTSSPQRNTSTTSEDDENVCYSRRQWLASLSAASGAICLGATLTQPGVLIPALQIEPNEQLRITLEQGSWLVTSWILSGIIGGLVGGFCGDLYGRKTMLVFSQVPFLISWALIGQAENMFTIYVGRILSGWANGFMMSILPVYIGEIGNPEQRGTLISFINLCQNVGILISYFLGAFLHWRQLSWVIEIPTALSALAMMALMPETPYYLANMGRLQEAEESLKSLRGQGYNVKGELDDIKQRIAETTTSSQANSWDKLQAIWDTLSSPSFLRPFAIVGLFFATTQLSGIILMNTYLVTIFQKSGTQVDAHQASIAVAVLKLVASCLASVIVRLFRRRAILITSGLMIGLFMVLFGATSFIRKSFDETDCVSVQNYTSLFAADADADADASAYHNDDWFCAALNWLPFVALGGMQLFYAGGYEAVLRVLCGEMFPTTVRSLGCGAIFVVGNLSISVASFLFPHLLRTVHLHGLFLIYSAIMVSGTVTCYKLIPESRGRSLTDMERHFEGAK